MRKQGDGDTEDGDNDRDDDDEIDLGQVIYQKTESVIERYMTEIERKRMETMTERMMMKYIQDR